MASRKAYNRIKAVLADRSKSSKDLAEHLGKAPSSVSRWCTNDSQPSIETLFAIADYLEVEVSELLVPSMK